MAGSSRTSYLGLLLGFLTLLALPLSAQEVYTSNGSNGRIMRLDFASGTTATATQESGRKFLGLALRDDGADGIHLIVGDRTSDAVLFYSNAQGSGQVITRDIPVPDGPSLDAAGNLYLVSAGSRHVAPGVWRSPRTCPPCVGGYGDPQLLDSPPSSSLTDTLVVRSAAGGLAVGDLLVLSHSPARVYRYHLGIRTTFVSALPASSQPTGFAVTPANELLVATTGGSVLRFDANGAPLGSFATGLGKGIFKIAAGMQFGTPRAFIASRTAGTVVRYEIQANGIGTPNGSLADSIQTPNGVALTPNTSSVTPVGSPVTVKPLPDFELIFDRVTAPGFTTAEAIEFEDNRGEYAEDQSLRDFFPVGSPYRTSLPDVTIPWYVRGLRKLQPGDPAEGPGTGPRTFILGVIDTTAKYAETVEFHGFEDVRLGWDPLCPNFAEYDQEPRTFYSPEIPKGETPIVEGNVFTDVSKNCGSNRGGGWSFSLYLTGTDMRTPAEIIDAKVLALHQVIDEVEALGYLPAQASEDLRIHLGWLQDALGYGDELEASTQLGWLIEHVEVLYEDVIDDSVRNVSGEIHARARSAKFFVCKEAVDFDSCLGL